LTNELLPVIVRRNGNKGERVVKERKFYLGVNKGASDVFEGDPWFRSFAMEIAKFYGYPTSPGDTLSKQGKILSAYATINVTIALESTLKSWHRYWKAKTPITPELAEKFCRRFYQMRGEHILPSFHELLERTRKSVKTS